MSSKPLYLTDELYAYLVEHGSRPDQVVRDLIDETQSTMGSAAGMQIAPDQAAFLTMMTRITGVRHAVEVGTFTGLSSLSIARGLPSGGRLVCCDVSEEYTSVARRYWDRAGVADRIELRLGPAADTLRAMPTEPHIDLAFIDADKVSYPIYWAEIVSRTRPGGVILVDNVLRGGRVLQPDQEDDKAIAQFNEEVLGDDRVDAVMLPIADGLTPARRR